MSFLSTIKYIRLKTISGLIKKYIKLWLNKYKKTLKKLQLLNQNFISGDY